MRDPHSSSSPRYGGRDRISTKTRFASELHVLGTVLARLRERAGLKQSEVAGRLGLPASYLSKIENGARRVDVIELLRLASAIGAPAADIIRELESELAGKEGTGPFTSTR